MIVEMKKEKYNIEKELNIWLSDAKRVVVAGIGNPFRMDDYVGVDVIRRLHGKVSHRVCLVECETIPESYAQQILDFNPTHILLIDAAVLNLEPGESRLIEPKQMEIFPVYSTHALPLRIFCEYLVETIKAKITLLLIQPQKTDFGEGLTAKIDVSAQKIGDLILRFLPH